MILHARYRPRTDTTAPVPEQDIEAPTYEQAYAQAVGDTPDGHVLLSVRRVED